MKIKTTLALLSCIAFSPITLSADFTPDFNIKIRLNASTTPIAFEFRGDQAEISRGIKVKCLTNKKPLPMEICKIKNTTPRGFGGRLVTSEFYDYKILLSGEELEIPSGAIYYIY